jgi:hypothetical protein
MIRKVRYARYRRRRTGAGQKDQAVLDILVAGLEPESAVTEGEIDRVEALSNEGRRFGGCGGRPGMSKAGSNDPCRDPAASP